MALPLIAAAIQFAPELARLIGGSRAESTARVVGQVLTEVVPGAKSEVEALEQLRLSPELQLEFRKQLLANELRLVEIAAADTADARRRDVEVRRLAGGSNDRANAMIALAAVGSIGAMLAMLALGWFKAKFAENVSSEVFGALLAQLATIGSAFLLCLRDAFQFEFGSSRGSRLKDETALAQSKEYLNG